MSTRRHEALIPLTHDHHHALAQARRLVLSGAGTDADRMDAASDFVEFFDDHGLLHFREEEETLFPLLVADPETPAPAELVEALVDHARMHWMVARLREQMESGAVDGGLVVRIGETLQAHVRLEEKVLFPLIERAVDSDALSSLTFAERRRG